MFTKLSRFVLGADLSVRAGSSHPNIRRPSVPDLNWNEGTLLLTFIYLMTLLPNQSFPVISLTKHNLALNNSSLNIVLQTTHLAGLIVHSSGLSKFSWIPVEVIIELLNCFISLLLTLGIQDCKIFSPHLSFNFLYKLFSLCNTYFKPF